MMAINSQNILSQIPYLLLVCWKIKMATCGSGLEIMGFTATTENHWIIF